MLGSLKNAVYPFTLLLLLIFLTSGGACATEDIGAVVTGNNSFATDLYGRLALDEGNLFFSPYSISTALAMTYAGARGETASQIATTLHFNLPQEKLHSTMSEIIRMIDSTNEAYQLSTANSVWVQRGFLFETDFNNKLSNYYRAGLNIADFIEDMRREETRKAINAWVEERTNNKIKDLIAKDILNELTRMVLVNAVYFKSAWALPFNLRETKDMPFSLGTDKIINVPMMHQQARLKYAENDKAQSLELPYADGTISMVVMLPKAGTQLKELEQLLIGNGIKPFASILARRLVDVYLPRFRIEKSFFLNAKLKELGIKDAFDPDRANFTGISPISLYISAVIHKAFIEVNEEGTEAAAATAVVMGTKSMSYDTPIVFNADHPFVFAIKDNRTESILFMGRVTNP